MLFFMATWLGAIRRGCNAASLAGTNSGQGTGGMPCTRIAAGWLGDRA